MSIMPMEQAPQAGAGTGAGGGMDLSALAGMDLENMTPEQLQQLAAMGALGDEQGILNDQIQTAEALRYGKDNRAEGVTAGDSYVAASPLSHVADAVQGIKAGNELEQHRTRQGEILEQQSAGREQFMQMILADALKKRGGGQQYPQAPSTTAQI